MDVIQTAMVRLCKWLAILTMMACLSMQPLIWATWGVVLLLFWITWVASVWRSLE